MKIVHIFGGKLWGVHWEGESKDAMAQTFEDWQDIEYLESFFERNRSDIQFGFYHLGSVEDAVWTTMEEAREMERKLVAICKGVADGTTKRLDQFFVPLRNHEFRPRFLSERKAKGPNRNSWLRLYAIKIDSDCFLIVGGAIKLTGRMEERAHTQEMLRKLTVVRDYLKAEGIEDEDGFLEVVV